MLTDLDDFHSNKCVRNKPLLKYFEKMKQAHNNMMMKLKMVHLTLPQMKDSIGLPKRGYKMCWISILLHHVTCELVDIFVAKGICFVSTVYERMLLQSTGL